MDILRRPLLGDGDSVSKSVIANLKAAETQAEQDSDIKFFNGSLETLVLQLLTISEKLSKCELVDDMGKKGAELDDMKIFADNIENEEAATRVVNKFR